MKKLKRINSRLGYIDVFANESKSILYAIPNGYVGPSLVKKDLAFIKIFDTECTKPFTYIVDTSKAKVVNPLNPFLLTGLKKFKKMKEYVVYAPSPIVRFLLNLSNWINKPDRIIKTEIALKEELRNV